MQSNFPKTPLIIALLFFVFSSAALAFSYRATQSNNNKALEAALELQRETNKRDEIRRLDSFVASIESDRLEVQKHFVQSSNIVPFLDAVENLAVGLGASAAVTAVSIPEDGSGLLVGMNASASFENLYTFIMLLENSDYMLEFISGSIQKEPGTTKWRGTFEIKLLSFIK